MAKKVLILVGLPGSGKSSAGVFFRESGLPVVRMGALTDRISRSRKIPQGEAGERKVREDLRNLLGADIFARESLKEVKLLLRDHDIVVIDGMRSPAEWDYFRKNLPFSEIIFLEAGFETRVNRLSRRKVRPLTRRQIVERDGYEVGVLGINTLKKPARYVIVNEGALRDLYRELEFILGKL